MSRMHLLLLVLVTSACAPVRTLVPGLGSGPSSSQADSAAAAFAGLLQGRDPGVVVDQNSVVRTPAATLRGRAEMDGLSAALGVDGPYLLRFDRQRAQRCTNVRAESGFYSLDPSAGHAGPSRLGRYVLLWERSGSQIGPLREAVFLPLEAEREQDRMRCAEVVDSTFGSRRVTLAIYPSPAALVPEGGMSDRLRSSAAAAGWTTMDDQNVPFDARTEFSTAAALRLRFSDALSVAVTGSLLSGRLERVVDPNEFPARLDYDGVVGGASVAYHLTNALSVSAGPALVRMSGDWATLSPYAPEPHDEAWSAWAVGGMVDAGVTMPVTGRLGFEFRIQHRRFPELDLPGFRGSYPLTVDLTHTALLLGVLGRM